MDYTSKSKPKDLNSQITSVEFIYQPSLPLELFYSKEIIFNLYCSFFFPSLLSFNYYLVLFHHSAFFFVIPEQAYAPIPKFQTYLPSYHISALSKLSFTSAISTSRSSVMVPFAQYLCTNISVFSTDHRNSPVSRLSAPTDCLFGDLQPKSVSDQAYLSSEMDSDPSSLAEQSLSWSAISLTHTLFTNYNLLKNKHNSPICHEHLSKPNPTVSLSCYSCHQLGMQSLMPQSPILWLQPLGVPASPLLSFIHALSQTRCINSP